MLDDGYHGCQDNNLAYGYCADVQSLGDGDSFAMRLKITESFCHHYLETTLDAPCETVFLKIVEGDGQTWIMYQTINISTSFRFFDDYYLDKGLVHDSSSNEESDVSLMATCLFPCCIVLLVLGLVIYYIDHREGKKKQKTIRFQQPRQTMPSPSSELILLQPSTTFSSSGEVRSGEVRTSLMQPSTFSSPPTQIRQPVSQEPNVDMSGVIAELENQKIRAESEAHRLNEQLKQQATTASELERMKNEMAALQQQASRHSAEKERLEKEEREWRIPLKHEHATEDYSMKGGREGSRLTSSQQGSDKIVSTLERLAVDENPEVKMLAIEKLAEIHSLNVEAQDRAYIDEKNKS